MSTAKKDVGLPANGSQELQDQLESNTMRVYQDLDEAMHKLHLDKGNEMENSRSEAERIAHVLLSHADLPLVFRCRALIILGCSDNSGYVEYAKEAVRFAELGMSNAQAPTEADYKLLADCKVALEQAEEDFVKFGGYGEEEDDGESEGEEEDEATAKAGDIETSTMEEDVVMNMPTEGSTGGAQRERGTASRRVDSARDVVQEFDEETGVWVDLGPVGEVEMGEEAEGDEA